MRVVHLHTNLRWGGGENQLFHLLQGIRGEEFRPLLLSPSRSKLLEKARANGIEAEPFDFLFRYGLLSMGRLAGLLREKGASILHLNDGDAASLGVPASLSNPKLRLIAHRRISSPMRANFLTRWKYSPKRIDAYIAVSRSAKLSLLEFGIPEEKVHVVPSGVDLAKLAPVPEKGARRRELGLEEGIWIGNVTTLVPKKNNETFLRAAARIAEKIPESRFLIVGDGPDKSSLQSLASSLGLSPDRLRFVGHQDEAYRYTAALDLFLFPSLREGSPGALKEAMALEIPVLAANSPGNDEIVRDGMGILVPPEDPEVYADAAIHSLKNSAWAREMAAKAAAWVRSEFSMEKMVSRTSHIYRDLDRPR